jgi:hypothetical protein
VTLVIPAGQYFLVVQVLLMYLLCPDCLQVREYLLIHLRQAIQLDLKVPGLQTIR